MALDARLRIGDSSTYDISLTSSGVSILDAPWNETPDVDQSTIQNLGDGNSLSIPRWQNVTESLQLHISDSTAANVAAKIRSIENVLNIARQGTQGWLDDRLYLRVQYDHDTLPWRSQILAAKLEMSGGANQIGRKYVRATLTITRRYYFETEALQDVQTSSNADSATTGFVTVYNQDGASGNRNWWQVAAAQVGGSIPAPATITILNDTGAARAAAEFYIGNYVFCDPTTVDPVFRQESATGTDTSITTTESDIAYWALSGGLLEKFRGQTGRIVVVWDSRPDPTTLVRAAFQWRPATVIDLALGEYVLSPSARYVVDYGPLPLPPGRAYTDVGDDMYLTLKGKAASSTDTISTDWMQVFPTGFGRYRVIKAVTGSLNIADGDMLVDDGSTGAVYYAGSGGDNYPVYQPFFDPIYLWPNRINRLRFIVSGGSVAFEADQPWEIKMQMRYRRLSF